jgi:hypothetical protein
MQKYHHSGPTPKQSRPPSLAPCDTSSIDDALDDYDCLHKQLVTQALHDEGWHSELNQYLADIPEEVTKDTDIVVWWGVSKFDVFMYPHTFSDILQTHSTVYPTLSRIVLDILPAQALSVPCKCLFSAGK